MIRVVARKDRPLTLFESVAFLGHCRYVEHSLFTLLGARARACSSVKAVGYVAGASLAHGWRARLLEERLPVSVGLPDATACTVSPSEALDAALAALVGAPSDADLLDGLLGGVYTAVAAGYAERLAVASPVADPPVVRLIGRLLADLDVLRRQGAEIAGGLERPLDGRRRAVEELLARGGGPFGPLRREAEAQDVPFIGAGPGS